MERESSRLSTSIRADRSRGLRPGQRPEPRSRSFPVPHPSRDDLVKAGVAKKVGGISVSQYEVGHCDLSPPASSPMITS